MRRVVRKKKMKPSGLIIAVALAMAGCTSMVDCSGRKSVILPEDQSWFAGVVSGHTNAVPWAPSKVDVAQAYPEVKSLFHDLHIPRDLSAYRFQCIGARVDGRRHIIFNFFPDNPRFPYWQKLPVSVDDGGDWYFQIDFDVESQQSVQFWINGEG